MLLAPCRVALDETSRLASTNVWCAPVDGLLRDAENVLDESDRAHVQSFHKADDRNRIMAARILLRHALSHEVGGHIAPAAWRFRKGPNGKPLMAKGLPPLHFNLSHAANAVAVAIGLKYPLGIDIESIAADDQAEIIPDMLTVREVGRLKELDGLARWTEFMRIWTLKEACAKAIGLGMSFDFRRMEIETGSAKVRLVDLPSGRRLEIEAMTTTVERSGRPYCLSVVAIDTDQPELLSQLETSAPS